MDLFVFWLTTVVVVYSLAHLIVHTSSKESVVLRKCVQVFFDLFIFVFSIDVICVGFSEKFLLEPLLAIVGK